MVSIRVFFHGSDGNNRTWVSERSLIPGKLQHNPQPMPPLWPVGKGCSGCVPVRCVETTLDLCSTFILQVFVFGVG